MGDDEAMTEERLRECEWMARNPTAWKADFRPAVTELCAEIRRLGRRWDEAGAALHALAMNVPSTGSIVEFQLRTHERFQGVAVFREDIMLAFRLGHRTARHQNAEAISAFFAEQSGKGATP